MVSTVTNSAAATPATSEAPSSSQSADRQDIIQEMLSMLSDIFDKQGGGAGGASTQGAAAVAPGATPAVS
jgi:hypothetical protein